MHQFSKLIEILLDAIKNEELVDLQEESLKILVLLATEVDSNNKILMGNLGAIEKILKMINLVCDTSIFDENNLNILKILWLILSSLIGD